MSTATAKPKRPTTLPSEAPPPPSEGEGAAEQTRLPWSDWPIRLVELAEIVDAGHTHRLKLGAGGKQRLVMLADSMRASGLQQPILVYRDVLGKYARVFGSRRCAAAFHLGWQSIAARVMPAIPTPAEMHDLRAIENFHREDLSPAEKAIAAAELVAAHLKSGSGGPHRAITEAAAVLGVAEKWVRDCLYIVDRLSDKTREFLAAGSLNLNQARALAKVGDHDVQESIAHQVVSSLPTQDGGKHGGNYGGRIWSVAEIENVIANNQHSLRVVGWELGVAFNSPFGRDQACSDCPNNSAVNTGLFESKQDEEGKGFCSHSGCYELRQKLVAKAQEKAVEKIRAQVKSKQLAKADAGGLEIVRDFTPEFVKPQSLQRVVVRELGIQSAAKKNETNGSAGGTKAGKKETISPQCKASIEFWCAYEPWREATWKLMDAYLDKNPRKKLAYLGLGVMTLQWPGFDVIEDEHQALNGKDFKAPTEQKVSANVAAVLRCFKDQDEEGFCKDLDLENLPWEIELPHKNAGPEFMMRLADAVGIAPEPPPKFEDFLPKAAAAEKPAAKGKSGAKASTCRLCGCTDEHACEKGCDWVDDQETICSRCVVLDSVLPSEILDFAKIRISPYDLDESGISWEEIQAGKINRVVWTADPTPWAIVAKSVPARYFTLRRLVPTDRWPGGEVIDFRKGQKLSKQEIARGDFAGVLVEAPYGVFFVLDSATIRVSDPAAKK